MTASVLHEKYVGRGIRTKDESKMRILAAHMLSVSRQPGLFDMFEAGMPSAIQLAHSN